MSAPTAEALALQVAEAAELEAASDAFEPQLQLHPRC
jgi:hypothetical protein